MLNLNTTQIEVFPAQVRIHYSDVYVSRWALDVLAGRLSGEPNYDHYLTVSGLQSKPQWLLRKVVTAARGLLKINLKVQGITFLISKLMRPSLNNIHQQLLRLGSH